MLGKKWGIINEHVRLHPITMRVEPEAEYLHDGSLVIDIHDTDINTTKHQLIKLSWLLSRCFLFLRWEKYNEKPPDCGRLTRTQMWNTHLKYYYDLQTRYCNKINIKIMVLKIITWLMVIKNQIKTRSCFPRPHKNKLALLLWQHDK